MVNWRRIAIALIDGSSAMVSLSSYLDFLRIYGYSVNESSGVGGISKALLFNVALTRLNPFGSGQTLVHSERQSKCAARLS